MSDKELKLATGDLDKIEKRLFGELFVADSVSELMTFVRVYVANYLPVLLHVVRNADANTVAKLLNSSIALDRYLVVKMNKILAREIETETREFINNVNLEESLAIQHMNRISSMRKASITGTLLSVFSFCRSALYAFYADNKYILNTGIGWLNLLIKFVDSPHLIFMLAKEDIQRIESELDSIKKDIPNMNGKLALEIRDVMVERGVCGKEDFINIPIHYIGLKLDWLKCEALLCYCKYLKTNKQSDLDEALDYSMRVIDFFESDDFDYDVGAFRNKLTTPGPSPNLRRFLGELSDYDKVRIIFNYVVCFEKGDGRKIVVFPTATEFYFNSASLYREKDFLFDSEDAVMDIHRDAVVFILKNYNSICAPQESKDFSIWKDIHSHFLFLQKKGLPRSFAVRQIEHSAHGEAIINAFEESNICANMVSNIVGISIVLSIDSYATASGLSTNVVYATTTIPLITAFVVRKLNQSKLNECMLESMNSSDDDSIFCDDDYETYSELKSMLQGLDESTEEFIDALKMDCLGEINELNKTLMSMFMSAKSIEQINIELRELYEAYD